MNNYLEVSVIRTARTVAIAIMLLFPTLFLAFVWSVCSAQADGIDVDWAFTRWLIVFFGLICFFGFACVLMTILDTTPDEEEQEPEPDMEPTILVVAIPDRTPVRRESIAPQLVAAALAGVAGGLLAHFVLKRRDRQR